MNPGQQVRYLAVTQFVRRVAGLRAGNAKGRHRAMRDTALPC